ncbi:MAG: hypothetical protein JST44_08255 [Cyanobacteria bacterium SZAS LIN-5]|nr:hypothetical protein [Cyanobacteria bacterium SZAS LIN-5]RTL43082.1 MAG: hypothetical protein EKK48_09270 [Candidatus Melainabacteria bacterium]
MSAQLTGFQLGGLLKQRRYQAQVGQSANAISLDGGNSWWEFYLEDKDFAIGGAVTHSLPAQEEWNPIHAGLSYSVVEVGSDTDSPFLVVRFGFPESRSFVFRVRTRPIQLVRIDSEGKMSDAGTGDEHTLDVIEYVGRVEEVLPDWRDRPQRVLR